MTDANPFTWRQYQPEILLLCVRWYLRYALSYRDLEELMTERGLGVDHSTIFRWVQRSAPELERRVISVDKNAAYPKALRLLKQRRQGSKTCRLRQVKCLNNLVEQDHRALKRVVRPGLDFGSFATANRTLAGYEALHMLRKGQGVGIFVRRSASSKTPSASRPNHQATPEICVLQRDPTESRNSPAGVWGGPGGRRQGSGARGF
jgi:transposase-like protein